MNRLLLAFTALFIISCKGGMTGKLSNENHLINESSPYLLQHAHNPVDWYPWDDVALDKAKTERKIILVSIGYASCHWCHVMEKESFSDTAVARLMNQELVNIKVDREERPDIDNVYMTACQAANQNGACGWPLNVLCTPEGRPFWVGTYLSKQDWMNLIHSMTSSYNEDPNNMEKMASQIERNMRQINDGFVIAPEKTADAQLLEKAFSTILGQCDQIHGGRNSDLKFPLPVMWNFCLQYGLSYKNNYAVELAHLTARKMMNSGLYDQLSGGFARYATDAQWKVPHFEKMLYDNAQLISLYSALYKHNKNEDYRIKLNQTVQFMFSDFKNSESAYYSSYDADSDHEEGKYYTWTYSEMKTLLSSLPQFPLFEKLYQISEAGNWEHGRNVLHPAMSLGQIAKEAKQDEQSLRTKMNECHKILLEARKKRNKPALDDKVICSWNGLMLKALCDAYTATADENYFSQAKLLAQFLKTKMIKPDGSLFRIYKNGKASGSGFLDDYASVILGFQRMYELSFDEQYLNDAKPMLNFILQHFSDEQGLYFYYNSDLDKELIARKKEMEDQAMISSNALAAEALYNMGLLYDQREWLDRAKRMIENTVHQVSETAPVFYTHWLNLYIRSVKAPYEIAIVGQEAQKLNLKLQSNFIPNAIFLGGETEGSLELLKEKLQDGQTMIYVCRNKICKLPVDDVEKSLKLIN
ncbi:MAG TPA: thioredoxin domain-containing protein [Saprospiraceae bacterium]|nr:thioredoxin domain-containing protein [Saprospiraceae bacterium]